VIGAPNILVFLYDELNDIYELQNLLFVKYKEKNMWILGVSFILLVILILAIYFSFKYCLDNYQLFYNELVKNGVAPKRARFLALFWMFSTFIL